MITVASGFPPNDAGQHCAQRDDAAVRTCQAKCGATFQTETGQGKKLVHIPANLDVAKPLKQGQEAQL